MRSYRRRARGAIARPQRGSALLELAIAASIAAVIAAVAAGRIVQQVNDAAAQATGTYLLAIKGAMDAYLVRYYEDLANDRAIPGFAAPRSPRLAELRAVGMLGAGFPDFTPFNQGISIRLDRTGSCPGPGCRIDALAYATAPLRALNAQDPAFDLVALAVMSSGGYGGAAYAADPTRLRGPSFSTPNPLGAVAGVVGVLATLDTTQFNAFVRVRDTRDPDLQGALTVQGPIATHETITVRNDDGTPCVRIERSGVLTLNCSGHLAAKSGRFMTDGGDVVQIDPASGVILSQRLRAAAGLSTGRGSVFDVNDPEPTIRVSQGRMVIATANGLALTVDGQDLVAQGGVSTGRLGLRETGQPNTACGTSVSTAAGTHSEFARTPAGGLLVCAGGHWRAIADVAAPATGCAPNGAFATDRETGAGLFCRLGVWVRADDLLSSYVMVSSALVEHGTLVAKPMCGQLGSSAGEPAIYLIGQVESSRGSAFTRKAEDTGGAWRVQMLDYDGAPLAGPARAIAQVYCKY